MTTASTVSQKLWNYCNVLRDGALYGWEIVDSAARLGVMNLYLHGIGGHRPTSRLTTACATIRASTLTWR